MSFFNITFCYLIWSVANLFVKIYYKHCMIYKWKNLLFSSCYHYWDLVTRFNVTNVFYANRVHHILKGSNLERNKIVPKILVALQLYSLLLFQVMVSNLFLKAWVTISFSCHLWSYFSIFFNRADLSRSTIFLSL